jgi:NAD(P)-dependent dehydrogenase (short-subunit alcohol dehydrogenase family)
VTETPILDASIAALGRGYLDAIPKPLGRLATADEQARVIEFLAGSGAAYLAGQTLWVDGGYGAGIASGAYPPMAVSR